MRTVEHRCADRLAGAHPGLQDRILQGWQDSITQQGCQPVHQKKPDQSQKSQITVVRCIHIKYAQPHTI